MADTTNIYNKFFQAIFGRSPNETGSVEGISSDIAKSIFNAQYPNDFEYYQLSLELVKVNGDNENTELFFSFPVLPSQISENHAPLMSIYKTAGGVGVTDTDGFIPVSIQIDGNFGRSFKLINAGGIVDAVGDSVSNIGNSFAILKNSFKDKDYLKDLTLSNEFSSIAKSGYGSIKVLEKIYQLSKTTTNGGFYKLYLYNPILGNNYVVKIQSFKHFQNVNSSNMIPSYSMSLVAIAPANTGFSENLKNNINSAVSRYASNALSSASKAFAGVI